MCFSTTILPLPIPDPDRSWGASNCPDCNGTCSGHYLKPDKALQSSLPPMVQPPSVTLKSEFTKLKGTSPSSASIEGTAKKVLFHLLRCPCGLKIFRLFQTTGREGLPRQQRRDNNERQLKLKRAPSTIVVSAKDLIWILQTRLKSGLGVSNVIVGFILCVWVSPVNQKYSFVKIVKSRCFLCLVLPFLYCVCVEVWWYLVSLVPRPFFAKIWE